MSSQSLHTAAFILSLIGGIVIVVGSLIALVLYAFGTSNGTYYGMGPGNIGRLGFGSYGFGLGWIAALTIVAQVC
jgi:hypothetical protein